MGRTMEPGAAVDADLVAAGRALAAAGLVRGRSGNMSAADSGWVRITARGARLGRLDAGDIVDAGDARASTEAPLHLAIYAARPDVGAVIHTHSPYATAWSCEAGSLRLHLAEARYYGFAAEVGCAEADEAVAALGSGPVVLLADHGALAVASTVAAAVDLAESLEHQAQVAWLRRAS